ncbi:MAG: 2-C-methyl-D-erythritol 4-phosphate cytidylyltransferase [Ruminococcaceae bacterium]|nr:2-C-methyl-D-erythritol 4-phosphate cytidylyltransferase [Oscillospiraceae bacterium]
MQETKLKLDYTLNESKGNVPVIVVAAGSSSRMKGTNKQLAQIGSVPVVIKSLLAFENCSSISNIILVVRTEDLFQIQMLCEKYMVSKLTDIVCGGDTRQESVLKGFSRLPSNTEKVLIHDGARPFVNNEIICSVIDALDEYSAVTCGVKVKDTIKKVSNNGVVVNTVDRQDLIAVQTPQGVKVSQYLDACQKVDVSKYTDDTSIMEAAGHSVFVTEGSYKNFKITTKEDLIMANAFISEEEE